MADLLERLRYTIQDILGKSHMQRRRCKSINELWRGYKKN